MLENILRKRYSVLHVFVFANNFVAGWGILDLDFGNKMLDR